MNLRCDILRAILFLSLALPGSLLLAAPPELMVSVNKIVTVNGSCPVFLKGADVPSLEWTNTGDPSTTGILKSVQTTMDWGGNFIRLPLNQDRWLGQACGATAASYQAIVDSIVNTISGRNSYVLLDLHWSDTGTWGSGNVCGANGTNGEHDMPDDNSTAFWASLAAHYANNPAVLFDLYNEPGGASGSKLTANAAGWNLWRYGGSTWGDGNYHSPGLQGLVTTVRATGARNIIVAGGINWAFDLSGLATYNQWLTDTAGTDGIVYATHIYPFKAANNGCSTACWSAAVPASVYTTHPVVVTEFGENSGQPDTTGAWPLSVCSWAEQYCQGWVAWCMHDSATPNLISDWNYTPTSWYGAVIKPRMASVSGGGCSGTPSFTPSRTLSSTGTATGTRTPSPSASATPSSTASATGTRTATPSFTPSRTPTSTGTASASATATATRSSSPTPTPSPTADFSGTSTVTRTSSPTPSVTRTPTPSSSTSPTFTDVPVGSTDTDTPTITPTATPTEDPSATTTASGTATLSGTPTASPTATASGTATLSGTPTASASPTAFATPPSSPSPTASSTASPTPSATPTAGGTATFSPSPTVAAGGGLRIIRTLPVPNPNPKQIAVELTGPADSAQIKFWTVSLRLVGGTRARQLRQGWNSVPIPAGLLSANGTYFYTLTVSQLGSSASLSKPGKLVME